MVDVVGRAEVDVHCSRDGWKMEDVEEGKRGIPMSFRTQNRTNLISLPMYIEINNALLSGPHAQTPQNNMQIIPLGATLR